MAKYNHLTLDMVIGELSEDERARVDESVSGIITAARSLSVELRDELAEYWKGEAESAANSARMLANVAPDTIPRNNEAYYAIKDAAIQHLIFAEASARLTRVKEESAHTFDRKVGETLDEYKTRIKKYMDELE